jgi:hypothetical protein
VLLVVVFVVFVVVFVVVFMMMFVTAAVLMLFVPLVAAAGVMMIVCHVFFAFFICFRLQSYGFFPATRLQNAEINDSPNSKLSTLN